MTDDMESRKKLIKTSAELMGKEISDAEAERIVRGAMKKIQGTQTLVAVLKLLAVFLMGATVAAVVGLSPWDGVTVVGVYSIYRTTVLMLNRVVSRSQAQLAASMFREVMAAAKDGRTTKTSVADLFPPRN